MAIEAFFTIEINGLKGRKLFDTYPTEDEIEKAIRDMFPQGYIYDQFADEYIYPIAQVKKIYKLKEKE
ncbi:hypothetical protein BC6307_18115 [Sutcliffiella cohnii]|uniref:Uncharacterized protein n=1 Tax=Sutcliffiella cohnii TaxID=33932 RepID=A0A223KUA1_9BACI|nr:hypothetical protein [Sutcliffiella cohnii]AST93036.1 hypothetical protein BC6307_18115 [Sutcliffiella cohnii]